MTVESSKKSNGKSAPFAFSDIPSNNTGTEERRTQSADENDSSAKRPRPIALQQAACSVPFPVHALPRSLQNLVTEVARSWETPADLVAMLGLAAIATCCQKRWSVQARPGWIEPTNLYIVVALPPAEMKSKILATTFRPLRRIADDLRKKWQETDAQREQKNDLLKESAKGNKAIQPEYEPRFKCPRMLADDVTPERFARMLSEQGECLAIVSDEATVVSHITGLYSKTPNNGIFLKAWDGSPYTIDRQAVDKPPIFLNSPIASMALAIQPTIVQEMGDNKQLRGVGMWARFLYSFPVSRVGTRTYNEDPVPREVLEAYDQLIAALIRCVPRSWGHYDPFNPDDFVKKQEAEALQFDCDAWETLRPFVCNIDQRCAPGRDLCSISDWAGKLRGAVVRIAGLLHVADAVIEGEDPAACAVNAATVRRAITIGEYLLSHAKHAFATMEADPVENDARQLLALVKAKGRTAFTERDLRQWSRYWQKETVRVVTLARLVDMGHLVLLPPEGNRLGKRYQVVAEHEASTTSTIDA